MSKFCDKCGAQLEDGVLFCDKCGAKQEPVANNTATAAPVQANDSAESNTASPFDAAKGVNSSTIVGIIAAAAVALVVIVVLVVLFSGGAKKSVKSYMKAFEKGDSKKMLNLTVPKKIQEDYLDYYTGMDEKEYVDTYDSYYDAMWKGLKEEGKVKVDYEIKEAENLDKLKKLKKDVKDKYDGIKELEDFKDALEDEEYWEEVDFDVDKVKKAYAVEIKYTITVDKDKIYKGTDIILVYKYQGDWILLNTPVSADNIYWAIQEDAEREYNEKTEKEEVKCDYQDAYDNMTDIQEDIDEAYEESGRYKDRKNKYDSGDRVKEYVQDYAQDYDDYYN